MPVSVRINLNWGTFPVADCIPAPKLRDPAAICQRALEIGHVSFSVDLADEVAGVVLHVNDDLASILEGWLSLEDAVRNRTRWSVVLDSGFLMVEGDFRNDSPVVRLTPHPEMGRAMERQVHSRAYLRIWRMGVAALLSQLDGTVLPE